MTRVVCVGLATRDTILAVPRHPGPDERVLATGATVAGGGPAATAAVTLARLGVEVVFAGAIGDDDAGLEIRHGLAKEGVDVSLLRIVPGARSPQSTILVGPEGSRTIVHVPGTATLAVPDLEADWVHVDHVGYGAVRGRGYRLSVDGGNPIPGLDLAEVDLYAPSEAGLDGRTPADALAAGAGLVVVTRGARGSVAHTRDGEVLDVPAPAVEVVSTLGAGDVFHGALLAGLVRDLPLREALAAANEVAALSCLALDGRSAIPAA